MTSPAKAREQRVVIGGAVVLLVAFTFTYGVLPFARAWQQREERIALAQARASRLASLVQQASSLEQAAATAETALAGSSRRVLHAASVPLAASALQSLLQDAGDGAGMAVDRVDVDADVDSTGTLGATLSAYGDIHGLASLLRLLEQGPRVTRIVSVSVQQNSALRGAPDVIQVSVGVRAPVIVDAPAATPSRDVRERAGGAP